MLTKLLDVLGRTALFLMALLLTRKAKLRAVCWAMRWLAKKARQNPLCIQYSSDLGTLSLTVTTAFAQLTWDLPTEDDISMGRVGDTKKSNRHTPMAWQEDGQ
jgi:hypothetical protein